MRFIIDVKSDKEKEFLQIVKALENLRVVKSCKAVDPESDTSHKASLKKEKEKDVSSRDMASQYRDLVD